MTMNYQKTPTREKSRITAIRPSEVLPKHAHRKMVVLFTDIVGSTDYFRSHGNLAGRNMLQTHQDLASKPIVEYGGYLVKTLGDSVMAHFIDPRKAIRSAIKIQQGFQSYNEAKAKEKQIHIRIGIHLGEAIIEEKDIFGDVVNMAAKLVQVAEIDQILISQDLYDVVKDLSHGLFQLVDVSSKRKIPKGLTIYQVLWRGTMAFGLTTDTLVYLKPLLNPDEATFKELWESVLASKGDFWGGKVDKEGILADRSVVLIIKDAALCIPIARDVLMFLEKNLGQDRGSLPLPIQILIDSGSYLSGDRLVIDSLEVNWDEIAPGRIYISRAAYGFIHESCSFSTIPPFDPEQPRKFYHIILDNEHHPGESRLFPYHNALIQGENPPCFYCGDRRHLSVHCPSKQLMELTDALKRLGYLSLDKISKLFYHYLSGDEIDYRKDSEASYNTGGSNLLAYQAFYELKAVFQLRFFTTLWDSTIPSWEEIGDMRGQEAKGGPCWLAQDCIRVANLAQAEAILKDYLEEDPEDYKGYCTKGFLCVEKANFPEAGDHFEMALRHARTRPQRVFLLFLLFRLRYLLDDFRGAEKRVKQILMICPQCQEAIYQDVIVKFRKGLDKEALPRLTKLMEASGEYYVKALIDPELAPFGETIHPELERLLAHSKKEANEIVPRAQEGLEQIRREIGEKDKEADYAGSILSRIDELVESDSYTGYREIIHHASVVISIANERIKERRGKIQELLYVSSHRCREYLYFTSNYPYGYLVSSIYTQLKDIDARIDEVTRMLGASDIPGGFQEAFRSAEIISADLDGIGPRIRRLGTMRGVMWFLTKFLKRGLFFQILNLCVCFIVIPVIVHYLNLLAPEPGIFRDLWSYQKGFLVIGGISGLLLAFFTATKGRVSK
jgi:class 3 adenylate cyclase